MKVVLLDCSCCVDRAVSMAGAAEVVALALFLTGWVLPSSYAAEYMPTENSLNVFRQPGNSTVVTVTAGVSEGAAVDVRTGSELLDYVRNGYRHIIIRSHLNLSGTAGMDPDSFLVPAGHLALMVRYPISFSVELCITHQRMLPKYSLVQLVMARVMFRSPTDRSES